MSPTNTVRGRTRFENARWIRLALSGGGLGASAIVGAALMTASLHAGAQRPASSNRPDPEVTPVEGPSWLTHLGLPVGQSGLGRSGAAYGPPPDQHATSAPAGALPVGRPVTLTGADIYRVNCQACHRAEGSGAPPEIKSVVAAVQGSSLELVRQRLKEKGTSATTADARSEADRARTELFDRIRKGGQKMPPLSHLGKGDLEALYSYLAELAGTPDRPPAGKVTASWDHLGEQVVKGTCHICHDAVGERPTDQARLQGAVPPFNVLLQEKPVVDFLTKVRSGAPVTSDDARAHYRGRMPVFAYLRDIDVAAAYSFLVDYPPRP